MLLRHVIKLVKTINDNLKNSILQFSIPLKIYLIFILTIFIYITLKKIVKHILILYLIT